MPGCSSEEPWRLMVQPDVLGLKWGKEASGLLPYLNAAAVRLLADGSWGKGEFPAVSAQRVDVYPASSRVPSLDSQALWRADPLYVSEYPLCAGLMEFIDVPEGKDIKEQAFAADLLSFIVDEHASPVRLAGDRAV